ncbi:hypothetical protein EPUS_05042 [Endocarpon pusillum Z07020]|uniref:SprT-like domain-containing protein n=1 Tax=Endocarpon pusillum (strain Z07020 / HMAS-L-300199) TaxID=1263415 RepID=U1GM27_ENDPU|nr:uncharacterized protein EPUS_05042 [Endocarpon pusillum Z07020]ERF72961.1 hypothetical protein EPUS_05042 [Endocarpon pusillum Z07020]
MAVRTSPRKKRPGAAGRGGTNLVGAPYAEHSRPKHHGEEEGEVEGDDNDELPELSTLLGCTAPPTEEGRKGREQGERLLSPNKKKQGGVSAKMSTSSASRKESRTKQLVETGDSISGPQSTAMLPRTSSSSLVLGATPSLVPTASATSASTTTTTITSSKSSRQTMQQRRRSPAKQENTVSPIKRSIGAFPLQDKDDVAYLESQSLISGSRAAPEGPPKTGIHGGANRRSRALKLQHVNSLLSPLRSLTLDSKEDHQSNRSTGSNSAEEDIFQSKPSNSKCRLTSGKGRGPEPSTSKRTLKARAAMFVLKEAVCKDDDGDDDEDLESEDDFTDLSGFIVGDDEEISFHGSETDSGSASDRESDGLAREKSRVRKRLMRGASQTGGEERSNLSDAVRSLSLEDTGMNTSTSKKKEDSPKCLADAISGLNLNDGDREQPSSSRSRSPEIEVIDLTSPVKPQLAPEVDHQKNNMPKRRRPLEPLDQQRPPPLRRRQQDRSRSSESDENAANEVDDAAILRFSPPPRNISPFKIKDKSHRILLDSNDQSSPDHKLLTTPPQTPPASPSKLKSPTKLNSPSKKNPLLLSPSKRGAQIPQSPHRQSIDAFWSSEVINEWNDAYSPAKPPLTLSPRKRWKIFDEKEKENESEGDSGSGSGSGSESPSESPARRRRETGKSPTKTPARSPAKKAATEEKTLAVAAKRKFDAEKEKLAHDLLKELDERVAGGQLACLSHSTGGVKIIWSKNLRSTAGRANWRRTVVTTASLNSRPAAATVAVGVEKGGGVKEVQHHASIELAEKIIDNEERLVNTLAHEFCHLANFMVSGVRDRPHGVEFKSWAAKVTSTFRHHERDMYRQVEVTTKHNYQIHHKYLWVCVGTPPNAAKGFLNLPPEEEGCGAEYGRHSKSIDPAKHRCGRCKGVLVQVRPKPKLKPKARRVAESGRRTVGRSPSGKGLGLERLEQAMELVSIDED